LAHQLNLNLPNLSLQNSFPFLILILESLRVALAYYSPLTDLEPGDSERTFVKQMKDNLSVMGQLVYLRQVSKINLHPPTFCLVDSQS
jgi:hypothetical protein